jgi:integrase
MIKSMSILFYIRKDKPDNNLHVPIYCRLTIDGKRSAFGIKRMISPERWDALKGKAKGSNEESKALNDHISLIKNKIYECHHKLEQANDPITADVIKNLVLGKDVNTKTERSLLKTFKDHNTKVQELIGVDFAHGTWQRYETCYSHMTEFILWKYNSDDYNLSGVNNEFISDLDHYLRTVKSCCNNTTVKYLKNFKKVVRIALANGWLTSDPFLNYKVKLKKVDRGYLTQQELDLLTRKSFALERISQVRDIFLFQCYTGLAYCDVKKLTKENIMLDGEGQFWIKTHRTKTKTNVHVPLLPKAIEILKKYLTFSEIYVLPVSSNQKMNSYLKEVADLCEIKKRLSTHLARHTFATTVTLANGISLEVVSKMLGHTNFNTTKIYARLLDTRVSDEMNTLKDKLNQKMLDSG